MFFYITLHSISTEIVCDKWWDPFNRRVELFQTWRLCELDPLISPADPEQKAHWVRQGFSLRGAPNDGTSFAENESRDVVDPQITFGFPAKLIKEERGGLFRFDVHYWEADNTGADKVRALFADSTLSYMTQAWKVANQDEEAAKTELARWLTDNWKEIVTGLIAAAAPAAAGVIAKFNLLQLVEVLGKVALNQGANYHEMHRYIFEIKGTGSNVRWRVISPTQNYEWVKGEGNTKVVEKVKDAPQDNVYSTEFRFRVVD